GYVPFYKENEYAESGMVISELGVGQSSERGGEAKDNYAEFKVNVSSGGLYNLAIRYANDEPAPVMMTDGGSEYVHPYNLDLVERYAQIQINDNEPETVYFRNTLSWDVFRTMDIPVRLSAGENTVRIYNDNSYQISSLVNSTAPEIDTVSIAPLNYTGEEISIVSETTGEEIDASYLDRLISEAAQYMTEEYTDETVSELRAAIQAADRTSQSAVNKSCNNIENAIKQMKLKPAPMWGTYLFENNSVSEDGSKTLETVTSALAEGGSIVYSEGRDGKGVAFNGSYGLDLGIVGREFTVSAWVKADSQSGMTTIFFKNMGDKNSQHWVGITVPGGKATVWQHNGSSQKWNQVIKAENSSAGEWAMYTYTEKNGVGTLYVNDEKIGEFSNMLATDKASLYMGATFWTADALKGTADDLLISDKEFTADEVRELYNQSLPIVLNAVLKDGKVEYSVSGKTDYNIYVALYDDGGKLVSLKLNDMQDSFELPGKGKYTVKLMIWDNMKPSSDAQIVEIENLS
ncbi:MAG: LamG-like jellyroll fold domain-containing protein, partial [Candidatus Ornithomonoglobus sp.]